MTVDFVTPVVSACLAANAVRGRSSRPRIDFTKGCARYAENIGLTDAIEGRVPRPRRGQLVGETYSPLEWLSLHEDVHRCNSTIGNVIQGQLDPLLYRSIGRRLVRIVGELHDNVASHASGRGFSAAQLYENVPQPVVRYAIADNGRGFLRNARSVDPSVATDTDAIIWAFQPGTTSSGEPDPWDPRGQRGLGDTGVVSGAAPGDHHAGEGLARLVELIDRAGGAAWVMSGRSQREYRDGGWREIASDIHWNGVAIELEIPLDGFPFTDESEVLSDAFDDIFL